MATREEVIAALKRKGYNGPIPDGAQAPQPQNDLASTLATLKASGLIKDPNPNFGHRLANAASIAASGNPIPEPKNDFDIGKTVATEAIKKQFEDPSERALREAKIKAYESYANAEPGEGFVKQGNRIMRDPTYKRQPTQEERSRELEDSVAQAELKDMAKALPKLDQANQAANQLKDLYGRAVKPNSVKPDDVIGALVNKLSGVPKTASALIGTNPELSRYSKNRKAFSGLISKGGFGEAGMLTQPDIERIASILPDEYSTQEEANIAWSEIEGILSSARKRFEDKRSQYVQNPGSIVEPLVDLEDEDQDPLGIL